MKKFLMGGVSLFSILSANNAIAAGYTCEELIEYTSCMQGYYLNATFDGDTFSCPDGFIAYKNACWEDDMENFVESNVQDCLDANPLNTWYGSVCARILSDGQNDILPAGSSCPAGYKYSNMGACVAEGKHLLTRITKYDCEDDYEGVWHGNGDGCYKFSSGTVSFTELQIDSVALKTCELCPAGAECAGGTSLLSSCEAGTYQPNRGQSSCLTTPAGNYSEHGAVNYTACAAGKYQPDAGQGSCKLCDAGSFCATTGLTAPTGECEIGEYSSTGATVCESCPDTGMTDINDNVVVAKTAAKGSTSVSACFIDPDAYFKNDKGTYHYKQNCVLKVSYFPASDGACATGYVLASNDDGEPNKCFLATRGECERMITAEMHAYDETGVSWNSDTNSCECITYWLYDDNRFWCDW